MTGIKTFKTILITIFAIINLINYNVLAHPSSRIISDELSTAFPLRREICPLPVPHICFIRKYHQLDSSEFTPIRDLQSSSDSSEGVKKGHQQQD